MGKAPYLFIHTTGWGKTTFFEQLLQFFSHITVYFNTKAILIGPIVLNLPIASIIKNIDS